MRVAQLGAFSNKQICLNKSAVTCRDLPQPEVTCRDFVQIHGCYY